MLLFYALNSSVRGKQSKKFYPTERDFMAISMNCQLI